MILFGSTYRRPFDVFGAITIDNLKGIINIVEYDLEINKIKLKKGSHGVALKFLMHVRTLIPEIF
jgi:hypothetical protein